jgi:ferredoxin
MPPTSNDQDKNLGSDRMRVSVDEDRCVGGGQCVMLAPDVFDQRDDDGVVILIDETPPEGVHDAVREAAQVCPAAAIRFETSR